VRSILGLGAAVILTIALAACAPAASSGPTASPAGGGATATPAGGGATPTAVAGGSDVTIQNFAFNPASLTVKVGATVTWTQKDSAPHFVKWDDGTEAGPTMASGDVYRRTFDKAGTFTYVCGIHATMKGSITVTP